MGKGIRVLIADAVDIARETLADVVAAEPDLELVATAADIPEAVQLTARHRPDVALVDVRMPGNGREAARLIGEASPTTRVVALSATAMEGTESLGRLEAVAKNDPRAIVAAIQRAIGSDPEDAPPG